MDLLLNDQVALITGASRDIGRAVAVGLARQGAHLSLCDIPGSSLAPLADEVRNLGREALAFEVDFENAESIQEAFAGTVAHWSRLDILVNNLVIEEKIPFLEVPVDSWDRQFDFNARAPFLCAQAAAREMAGRGQGVIVNVGSVAGDVFWPNTAAYNASRGALISLTGTLGLELAPLGIRVNGIAAGHIETEMEREKLADPAVRAETASQIPLGRVGCPEDLVGTVLFLASDASAYVVGQTLFVDGGYVLR
jgi:NAD(P)-dependent dehydrogenase (short-subunit alcohol dehydrogenase family)